MHAGQKLVEKRIIKRAVQAAKRKKSKPSAAELVRRWKAAHPNIKP